MKKKGLIAALLLLYIIYLPAQVSVDIFTGQSFAYKVEDIWKSTILNSGSAQTVKVVFTINSRQGQQFLQATTPVFTLNQGINSIAAATRVNADYEYFSGNQGFLAQQSGTLPYGEFVLCATVYSATDNSNLGNACVEQNSMPVTPPQLIYPSDGEEIYTLSPMLTWLPPQPQLPGLTITYNLVLVEVQEGQTPVAAILGNTPHLELIDHERTQFQYSALGMPLEYDKTYAWKVSASNQSYFLGETDVWTFKPVRVTSDTTTDKERINTFPVLKPEVGKLIYSAKKYLRFAMENDYNPAQLNIKIIDAKNNEVKIKQEQTGEQTLQKVGRNKYILLIEKNIPLKDKQIYTLQLKDNVDRMWFMTFKYNQK